MAGIVQKGIGAPGGAGIGVWRFENDDGSAALEINGNESGAAAGDGTVSGETILGPIKHSIVTFTDTIALAGANLGAGALVYTMPAKATVLLGARVYGTLTAATETATPEIGLGTVVASGAITALGGTPTFENIITGTTVAAISSGGAAYALPDVSSAISAQSTLLPVQLPASSVIHANIAGGFTATEDLTFAGTVELLWCEFQG